MFLLIDLNWNKYYKYLERKILDDPLYIKYHPDITSYDLWINEQSCYAYKETKHTKAMKIFYSSINLNISKIKLAFTKLLYDNTNYVLSFDIVENIMSYKFLIRNNITNNYYFKAFDRTEIYKEWDKLNLEYFYIDENKNVVTKNIKHQPEYLDQYNSDEEYYL